MKKLLTVLLAFFALHMSYSQLLRSEIYDFSIGDYYEIEHISNQSGQSNDVTWKLQTFHILGKQVSVGGDTVTYSAQRQTYFPSIQGSSPSLEIDTVQFSHVNLNAIYSPTDNDLTFGNSLGTFWYDDTTGCYTQFTSLSNSSFCSGVISQQFNYRMEFNDWSSCISSQSPLFVSDYKVYSHAGGPYGGKDDPGEPNYVKQLIHLNYVNHNGIECGNFPNYFLGVEELNQLTVSVSPNPAMDKLSVSGVEVIKAFSVTTSEGRIMNNVSLDTMNNLDVSKLTNGIYFLHLTDQQGRIGMISFVKQ
ncbi:MAG: T9SS type A sorting domain-containing protein [Fluviicola sp.]